MSFEDNAKATLAMQEAMGDPGNRLVISKADMKKHAEEAAARGAKWLDVRHPGWFDKADYPVLPFPRQTRRQYFVATTLTVGMPEQETEEEFDKRVEENRQRFIAAGGDTAYTPIFTETMREQGALAIAKAMGLLIPQQEMTFDPHKGIDLGYYGFIAEFMPLAFGVVSGTRPTEQQLQSIGYCKDDAAVFLADAWTKEIKSRRTA